MARPTRSMGAIMLGDAARPRPVSSGGAAWSVGWGLQPSNDGSPSPGAATAARSPRTPRRCPGRSRATIHTRWSLLPGRSTESTSQGTDRETLDVHTREIRELADRFSVEQLERCLTEELDTGDNRCELTGPTGDVVSTLAEAELVREQVDRGVPLIDSIRELARRMRAVQQRSHAQGSATRSRPGRTSLPAHPYRLASAAVLHRGEQLLDRRTVGGTDRAVHVRDPAVGIDHEVAPQLEGVTLGP